MTRVEITSERLELEQRSWFFPAASVLFLALAALTAAAASVSPTKSGGLVANLAPILSGAVVGLVFGYVPRRRSTVATRVTGEVVVVRQSLFGKSESRCPLEEVKGVKVLVSTYSTLVFLTRKEGSPLSLMAFPKRWTWESSAGPSVMEHAREAAGFFGVPLDAPPAPAKV